MSVESRFFESTLELLICWTSWSSCVKGFSESSGVRLGTTGGVDHSDPPPGARWLLEGRGRDLRKVFRDRRASRGVPGGVFLRSRVEAQEEVLGQFFEVQVEADFVGAAEPARARGPRPGALSGRSQPEKPSALAAVEPETVVAELQEAPVEALLHAGPADVARVDFG